MLYPGYFVPCHAMTKSTSFTAEQINAEIKMVCKFGLGKTKLEKPQGGGRLMLIFNKISTNNLSLKKLDIMCRLSKSWREL